MKTTLVLICFICAVRAFGQDQAAPTHRPGHPPADLPTRPPKPESPKGNPFPSFPTTNEEIPPGAKTRMAETVIIKNGVKATYRYSVVDQSPRMITVDLDKVRHARIAKIEVERVTGINTELRERWDDLNAQSATLKMGMTLEEVVKLLGRPNRAEIWMPSGSGYQIAQSISIEDLELQDLSDRHPSDGPVLRYTPYKDDEFRPRLNMLAKPLPYDRLALGFDSDLKLRMWVWEPGQTEHEFKESKAKSSGNGNN